MINYLFKILLYTKAKITINKAPVATGIITNSIVFAPKIAIIGLAPAGGWIVLVIIIRNIAKDNANDIEIGVLPKRYNIKTPDEAERIWPKKTFLGWANGLSCTAITNTKLAPNGGINQTFVSSIELK